MPARKSEWLQETPKSTPPLLAEAGEAIYSIAELATALGIHERTVRAAILAKELPAFIPMGKDPNHAGAGQGYRIKRKDAMKWYFGE